MLQDISRDPRAMEKRSAKKKKQDSTKSLIMKPLNHNLETEAAVNPNHNPNP